ncbi:YkgJ family cysteine cluster protein [Nanoarchaeota archaeon]
MTKLEKKHPCAECGAKCCKDVTIELDEPDCKRDFDDLKWMLFHENITIYIDNDDDLVIEFKTPCKMLDENNMCKAYDKRPAMCSGHGTDECVIYGDGEIAKRVFRTAEDIDEYYKEFLAKKRKKASVKKKRLAKKK